MLKLSVIVPVYNAEKYLERCVDSILNQSYSNFEIILVDDGSKDQSGNICDEYACRDDRIKVIHQKNAGVSVARNVGLDSALGDYVIFMDSDDYIDSDMYEKMIEKAEKYNCDLVMCDCVKEYPDHSELFTHAIRGGYYDKKQLLAEYYPQLLIMENVEYPATISNCLCMFKRAVCGSLRYLEGVRYSEDWHFGTSLIVKCDSFYYMKGDAYYHYFMNPFSATHTFVKDKWNDYQKLYKCMREKFLNIKEYDFCHQLDLVLLFLVIHAISEYLYAAQFPVRERTKYIKYILKNKSVKEMFSRLDIKNIKISNKLKVIVYMYKRRLGIRLLCWYYGR